MSLAPSSLLADVGCGNGKYFGVRDDLVVVGTDMSVPLCEVRCARQLLCVLLTASVLTVVPWPPKRILQHLPCPRSHNGT